MTEITDEQRAALDWLKTWSKPGSYVPSKAHAAVLLELLPSELTNPQPVLPTEPGIYASGDGMAWALIEDVGWTRAEAEGVLHVESARASAPFTRLVPERPPITREQVGMAVVIANGYGGEMGARAWIDRLHAALAKVSNRD